MRRYVLAALCGLLAATCNLGPLGGTALHGEFVREPMRDWSLVATEYTLDIQTQAPALLPSARTWFVVHEGTLWLYAMAPRPLEPSWIRRLRDVDPGVRIRVGEKLYLAQARLVEDPAAIEPLLPTLLRKYHMIETARARFIPAPDRYPGTQLRQWFFRVGVL